jgi:hydroxyacylglutathione hydrolase
MTIDAGTDDVPIATVAEASHLWATHQALFLDVREPREWNLFRIPGAVHVAAALLGDEARLRLVAPLSQQIIVYCGRGNRSRRAAAELRAAGYARVRSLDGGVMAWHEHGAPVEE